MPLFESVHLDSDLKNVSSAIVLCFDTFVQVTIHPVTAPLRLQDTLVTTQTTCWPQAEQVPQAELAPLWWFCLPRG